MYITERGTGHYVPMDGTGSRIVLMTKAHIKLGNNDYYKVSSANEEQGWKETLICTIASGVSLPLNTDNHQVVYDPGHNNTETCTHDSHMARKEETRKEETQRKANSD